MSPIDRYAYFNALTDVNPMKKMAIGILALLLSLIIESVGFHIGVVILMAFIIVGIAKIPAKGYFKLFKIPGSFLILSIITILISITTDMTIPGGMKIGPLLFTITPESKNMAIRLFFRALACISSSYFIALTIPINQQVYVFKKCHFPMVFIEMTVLIYRFINIFLEEFHIMQNGMDLKLGNRTLKTSIRSLSLLGTGIFIRVMDSYMDWKNVLDVKLYNGTFYF